MEEFGGMIFVLLFIAMSVMDGIGRRRKAREKRAQGKTPGPEPTETVASGSPAPDTQRPKPAPSAKKGAGGSEGLIPKEIWDEILGLARGAPPSPRPQSPGRVEADPQEVLVSADASQDPAPEARRVEARPRDPGAIEAERLMARRERPPPVPWTTSSADVGQAHRGPSQIPVKLAGTPEGSLAAVGSVPGSPPPGREGRRGRRLREDLFGDGSSEELKRAIILREVLGPPVGMRD